MTRLLLTGAGFSRNWGGWLADEAFEYLLGCPEVGDDLKALLWKHKLKGDGFEGALAYLQEEFSRTGSKSVGKSLRVLQSALSGMFRDMDQGFSRVQFEFQNDMNFMVRTFLGKFDAIFTLNQDLLLERHYLDGNLPLLPGRKWDGGGSPGLQPLRRLDVYEAVEARLHHMTPADESTFIIHPRSQPYFKLHGSSNWFERGREQLLIMGGNKAVAIKQYPLLNWYHKKFEEYLAMPGARLMIVGYSFGDEHINSAIERAVKSHGLRLFIIDPSGVDVMDKQGLALLIKTHTRIDNLGANVMGASRRPLSSVFGLDRVEHAKVMRFFTP